MIGNRPLYDKDKSDNNECESHISASMDLEALLAGKAERYVYVIKHLCILSCKKSMGITTDNLYNIKKRAISALTHALDIQ